LDFRISQGSVAA